MSKEISNLISSNKWIEYYNNNINSSFLKGFPSDIKKKLLWNEFLELLKR